MLGGSEFLGQILPLFIQLVFIPLLLGILYFAYQKFYLPRKNASEDLSTEPQQTNNNPTLSEVQASIMEDEPMTEKNQPTGSDDNLNRPQIDTGDLPSLDMLLGNMEATPIEEAPPLQPIQKEPPQIVQLREVSPDTAYVQLQSGQIAPAQEIITILRDEDDGRLMIQVGRTAYRTLSDDPNIKQLFTQIMKELAGTVVQTDDNPPTRKRYVVGTPPAEEPIFQHVPEIEPPTPIQDTPSIRELLLDDEDESEPISSTPRKKTPPPPQPGGTMPGDLPSFKLDDNPMKTEKKGRFGNQKVELEPLPELDLAAAIETYLQYKLQHTLDYRGRNIHIHGTPTGAIRIQVDEQYYDFVDEVADVEIRQFLQDTIAEWQERQ